ncbi:hypothetical protein TrLO_g11298 [Triparma laevis f. longispina]|uniref:cGMP-dependent protein kinase n=1 Tax=Triparma laevis f. longispina TaxID=1714387 RepID=A0A9W6ZUE2_9STRA|nr:hypothetical protein TrLO_g11298 [Triparma laevis f. longispina]
MGMCMSTPDAAAATRTQVKRRSSAALASDVDPQDPPSLAPPSNPSPAASSGNRSYRHLRTDNVFTRSEEDYTSYVPPSHPKNKEDYAFLNENLKRSNFIFESMDDEMQHNLIMSMTQQTFSNGQTIITQGVKPPCATDAGNFYLISFGIVSFMVNGESVGNCSQSGSFGELALLYDAPRAATCIAMGRVEVWCLDRTTFLSVLYNHRSSNANRSYPTLRACPLFENIDDDKLREISEETTIARYEKGHEIVKKGTKGFNVYVIHEGTVEVGDFLDNSAGQFEKHQLKVPAYFGDRSKANNNIRSATVTALTPVDLIILPDMFHDRNDVRVVFASLSIINGWQREYVSKLYDQSENFSFQANETMPEGCFYIISEGKADGKGPGGVVGWNGGFAGDEGCHGKKIPQETWERVGKEEGATRPAQTNDRDLFDTTIRFSDLERLKILGIGTFGRVWIVHHQKSKSTYALKMIDKSQVIRHHQEKGVMREKTIMSTISHPFIVNLITTFTDETNLYMLISLLQGGELFSVLHTKTYDGVPPDHASFYSHIIAIAMNHLHEHKICYRDLKPENVMIDKHGYCVVVDLGFAKVVDGKTYTLCGTPEYLAPEIILSKGHDGAVDWWAYGVLVYEMIYGYSPFYSDGVDQVTLFKRIVHVKYDFPEGRGTPESTDLISKLLVKRPLHRLGCSSSSPESDIFSHPFFFHSNETLTNRLVNAPWIPRITSDLDTANFDNYAAEELDEGRRDKLRKKNKLTKAQQALFVDF